MREILFRGKDIAGNWHYGVPLVFTEDYVCITAPHTHNKKVEANTIGQFTGMFDKNGTKIFEGDIIKTVTNSFDRDEFITEIKFGARSGVQGFYLANGRMMFYFGQKDLTVMDDTEIIGNIHDNPKLLRTPQNVR